MPVVEGTIVFQPPDMTASFTLPSGRVVTFKGQSPNLVAFSAPANLTYTNEQQLIGYHSYLGTLGAGSFSITLSDTPPTPGVTITGHIPGGPPQVVALNGTGSWS